MLISALLLPALMASAPLAAVEAASSPEPASELDADWAEDSTEEYSSDGGAGLPPDDGYPALQVLEAFATACSGIEIVAVAEASVAAAGWERFQPAPESAIARIVKTGHDVLADLDESGSMETIDGGIWRKQVAERELFIVLSGVKDSGIGSYGCRLYDLAASRALTREELQDWAVREPQSVPTGLPGAYKYIWNPGLKPGHMEMEASFVPQGTVLPAPLAGVPLSGIVLTASALEFLDQ